jgi:hypothetical protein
MREFPRAGLATVRDRRGRIYVGHVTITDTTVTVDGHRRERWHSSDGPTETRYRCVKTWPIGRVDVITWTTDATFELEATA